MASMVPSHRHIDGRGQEGIGGGEGGTMAPRNLRKRRNIPQQDVDLTTTIAILRSMAHKFTSAKLTEHFTTVGDSPCAVAVTREL